MPEFARLETAAEGTARAARHFQHGFAADRAVVPQCFRLHTQELLLGLVGIGQESADEIIGGTGSVGDQVPQQAACAGFRAGQVVAPLFQSWAQFG